MNYVVLDSTDDFLVVCKSPGICVQGDVFEPSLYQQIKQDLNLPELYPVHRLDKGTSGIVVFAKTELAGRELSLAFQERRVEKYYLALTTKKPSKKQGCVQGDMEKSRNGSYKLCRTQLNPAHTMFFSWGVTPGIRLFLLRPTTGKTHQLRVALKSLGAPILGDDRYGGVAADRLYLHAWQLSFPWLERTYYYSVMPDMGIHFKQPDIQQAILNLGDPRLYWTA
jgi:tRNA pseudouridine32 synthase / 23S rRNA pseudouridine746 synthase